MYKVLGGFSGVKTISLVFTLILISFFSIGGCSENNGGDGIDAPAPQTSCSIATLPCTNITVLANGTVQCDALGNLTCAADLDALIAQADPDGTLGITGDTVMWIEAWGAFGGVASPGNFGGDGGYAVTTTTINDVKAKNNGSSFIFYFYGSIGGDGGKHCGSSGGGSTIVTTEDYVLNPDTNPTQSAPPVLLVAGGGGGRAGENNNGFCDGDSGGQTTPAFGGTAIATMDMDAEGGGGSNFFPGKPNTLLAKGGNQDGMGSGGSGGCNVCNKNSNQQPGKDGYGGLGGRGGSGNGCGGPQLRTFMNLPPGVFVNFTSGRGGNGSFNQGGDCNAGGGGGGGGYGGGGGGSQQNQGGAGVGGAGGGSFAIQSTKASDLSPTTVQPNPCGKSGCVRITFAP